MWIQQVSTKRIFGMAMIQPVMMILAGVKTWTQKHWHAWKGTMRAVCWEISGFVWRWLVYPPSVGQQIIETMVTNHGIWVVLIPSFQTNPSMNGLMRVVFSLLQSVWTPNIWMRQSQQCFFLGGWESSYREAVALAARRVEAHRARLLTFRADLRFVSFGFCPNMGCSWVLLAAPKSHWSLAYFRIDIAIPLSRGQMSAQEKVTPHI